MKTRTKFFALITILACSVIFMGCPVSTTYPLGLNDGQKIEKGLIGTWKNDSTNVEAIKVTIKKSTEYTYDVTIEEKGSMYMAESTIFKGWLTTIKDRQFLVLQEVLDGVAKETYYVYHLTITKESITTNDITLKVGGTDAVTSVENYRKEVESSMEKEGFLAGPIVWKKQK